MKLQIQRPLPNKCLPMNTRVHDGVTFLATFRGQASQRKATVNAPCQIQQSKIMRMILKIAQSIYEIYYTFSNISRILSHILIKYIHIYIFLYSYFLSRHFFFIGSHIRFLEIKYYFSLILTRGKDSFQVIYPLRI